MTVAVMLAICALLGGQAQTYGKESVRLYVFTAEAAPGSSPDETVKGRLAAVRELRDALRHKAGLSVVDDRAHADVVVEVIGREQQDAGEGGFGGVKLGAIVTTTIRLVVTSGEHQTEMKGMGSGSGSRAAKDAADRLLKWIVRNRLDRS